MAYKLYKWQEKCLNKWKENDYKGIINVVTGAGKTTLALYAIKEVFNNELKIKIIVPTVNLLFQWKKEIINVFGEQYSDQISLIYSGNKNKKDKTFSIYVINSARHIVSKRIIDDMDNGFKVMMICDETHHFTSKENQKIFHYRLSKNFISERFYSLGLSATVDNEKLNDILVPSLGKIIFTLDHDEALSDDIISPFIIYETSINFTVKEKLEYITITNSIEVLRNIILKKYPYLKDTEDLKLYMKLLNNLAEEDDDVDRYIKLLLKRKKTSSLSKTRIACGVEIIKQLSDKRIIVFAERITQIKEFEQKLRSEGINKIACYHSKQSQEYRKRILDEYKNKQFNILLTCKALDEGVDVPDAEVAIVLSSSSVVRQRIQRLGRILRKNNDKLLASLFYLYVIDANDDVLYLEDLDVNKTIKLRYNDVDKSFSNNQYENQIIKFYNSIKKENDTEILKEYDRCLQKGQLRNDWLLSRKELDIKIKKSKTIAEKNYYVVMKKICIN